MSVLNPILNQRLVETFHHVQVSDMGRPMSAKYMPDWSRREARVKLVISIYGETYRVNCPFCSDTRNRLYINHRWAVRDPQNGGWNLHLVKCFNEDCVINGENQRKLHARVYPGGYWAQHVEPPALVAPAHTTVRPTLPIFLPQSKSLRDLAQNHPARRYLTERGFDPNALSRSYGVVYCEKDESSRPAIFEPRIVIPILQPQDVLGASVRADSSLVLAGWQARLISPEVTGTRPKYLTSTGTKKSHYLYGLRSAVSASGPLVVVEGITDVWKVGRNAVALLGKTISPEQCSLIVRNFRHRPIVIWLDADAMADKSKLYNRLRTARSAAHDRAPIVFASMPQGRKDPGECTAEEISATIAASLNETV